MPKENRMNMDILLAAACYLCKSFMLFSNNNNNWSNLCGH